MAADGAPKIQVTEVNDPEARYLVHYVNNQEESATFVNNCDYGDEAVGVNILEPFTG